MPERRLYDVECIDALYARCTYLEDIILKRYGVTVYGVPVSRSKGAGDLQYETGVQEDNSHSVSLGPDGNQGDQLELEDAIKEVNDNGC